MKKKTIVTLGLFTMIGLSGTAFAASSVVTDVPASHWAYDAVSILTKDGVISGYGDGTFRGDKTLTRYEMAQVVATAVAREDKATAQDKALIDRLSTEFAGELKEIGGRLANLEKNKPVLNFNGTVDVRYTTTTYSKSGVDGDSKGQYRLRLNAVDTINSNSQIGFRVASQTSHKGKNFPYQGSWTKFGTVDGYEKGSVSSSIELDRVYIKEKFGELAVTAGAQELKFGETDAVIDSDIYSLGGIKLEGDIGGFHLVSNYGRFILDSDNDDTVDVASLEAIRKIGKLKYNLGYLAFIDNGSDSYSSYGYANKTFAKYLLANATYGFSKSFSLGCEYIKNQAELLADADPGKTHAEIVYAVIGDQKLKKSGDSNIKASYYKAGKYSISRWSNWDLLDDGKSTYGSSAASALDNHDMTGYNIKYSYALDRNVSAYVTYEKVKDDQVTSKSDGGYSFFRMGLSAKI